MKVLRHLLTAGLVAVALAALAAPARAQLTSITGLFTTGVDASGTKLGNNVQETHYIITANTGGTPTGGGAYTVRASSLGAGWMANPASGSRWVVADSGGANPGNNPSRAAGTYDYTLTFTMPAGAQLTTVSISGTGAADNSATIYVNGVLVSGQSIAGSGSASSFTLNSANASFNSGSNTITFRVNNTATSATGLLINSFSGTVIVPENAAGLPAAVAVGAYALLALRRRWNRRLQESDRRR
jgi:hypothetical protein